MYPRGDRGRFVTFQSVTPPTGVPTPVSAFRRAEERGAGPSRQRMSLLHPPPQPPIEYNIHHASAQLTSRPDRPSLQSGSPYGGDGMGKLNPQRNESPPCKKLRLGDSKPDLHTPLRIDTDRARSGPAYNPQVEAISPTLPSESLRDESPLKSTKEELLQQIARVDREIAKTESQIAKLKKKKIELEEAATQPQKDTEDSNAASDSIIRSLPQIIYAENRKKALAAHQTLEKLGPKIDLPLYNQPSDTALYNENKIKYACFKSRLQEYFKARLKDGEKRELYLTTTYAKLSTEWGKRVDKMENNAKKRAKEAKHREIFEKMFPELRKQREDKERFSRVGARIKSDADLEDIMEGLHEQELEDKKMRSYAVIPPIILDERSRKRRFTNRNGLYEDPMQEYKDKQLLNLWTDGEKDIFKEKYLQHPKNFGIIKSYLERKSVADCVQYYYLSKKTQNYRQLLRKNRARTRSTRNQQQSNSAAAATAHTVTAGIVVKTEPNGVTTRQQKEQKSDTQILGTSGSIANAMNNPSGDGSNSLTVGNPGFAEQASENIVTIKQEDEDTDPVIISDITGPSKKKRKEDPKDLMEDSTDDDHDINGDKGVPHNCVVCKTRVESYIHSRPFPRSQAAQYGLGEDDIETGDRVCLSCRCKAVRRRYKPNQCPIPTCPAVRARIKRLRPFPPRWGELSEETREAICAKYQIPPNCTKCCTACFNRISRRLSPNANLDIPDDPGSDTTRWTDEEIDTIRKALVEMGTDWRKLSERVLTKSDLQCRNFYFNFRKKFELDTLVQEFKRSKGCDGPPTLTDEEESGSTTSSCDEGVSRVTDQVRPSLDKKDDYDSSATVSAEEGGPSEQEKLQSLDEMRTLPNHPGNPILASVRPNSISNPAAMLPLQHHIHPLHESSHHSLSPQVLHHNHVMMPSMDQRSSHPQLMPRPTPSSSSLHAHGHGHHPAHMLPSHHAANSPSPHHSHGHGHHQHQLAPNQHQSHQMGMRYPSPENSETHEQMTVKDLMLATIEKQLRRNPIGSNSSSQAQGAMHPGQSISPTITSILKSQDRSHLPPPGHMMQIQSASHQVLPPQPQMHEPSISAPSPIYPPYYGKLDLRGGPPHMITQPHDRFAITHASQPVHQSRDDCETLDLSIKRRPVSPHAPPQRPPSNGPPPAHQPLDFATRPGPDSFYQKYSPIPRGRPSPFPPPLPKQSKVPPPPPLTKPPTLSPMKDGSITHGTPMQQHVQGMPKYEGILLRPSKEGSITQGTPLDKVRGKEPMPQSYVVYDRPEYYKRMSPAASPFYHGSSPQFYTQRPPSTGQRSASPPVPQLSAYATDQHNTSRQNIIDDYLTSQQMSGNQMAHSQQRPPPNPIGSPRMDTNKRMPPVSASGGVYLMQPRHEVPYRQSPTPPSQAHSQQRPGVIHRTTPNSQRVVKVEPGRFQSQHDAFSSLSSLADVAVNAQSIPVPKEEPASRVRLPRVDMVREGLGKSMAEIERNRMASQIPQQVHMYRPPPGHPIQVVPEPVRVRKEEPPGVRFGRDGQDATLTAASLIDAIITHQISQPSIHDRSSPVPMSRSGDRLFASFQRSVPPPPPVSVPQGMHGVATQPPVLTSHVEDLKIMEEHRHSVDPKNTQGSTWGEHINLIISNDYASTKGPSGGSIPGNVQPQPPVTITTPLQMSAGPPQPKKDEELAPYICWKLRRALQHEKEQMQLQQNHPDERHIIRVAQPEAQHLPMRSSTSSMSKDISANDDLRDRDSHGKVPLIPVSMSSACGPSNENFPRMSGGREISPLDYVQNFIMEKMRTETKEDKSDEMTTNEGGSNMSHSGSSGSASHSMAQQGYSSGGRDGMNDAVSLNYSQPIKDLTNSENNRRMELLQEKKDDDLNRSMDSDSPSSMVIDESVDETKEKSMPSSYNEPASSTTNHPNYEPLTDEES